MKNKTPQIDFQVAENNFTLVIFGASGSLAKLKLFPAIYELVKEKRMPKDFKIVGYARTPMTDKEFRAFFEESVREAEEYIDEKAIKALLKHVHYFSGQYDEQSSYEKFKTYLEKIEDDKNRVRITYFSVPPSAFTAIFENLGKVSFDTKKSKLRLVIEKPFGYDLKSAKALQKTIDSIFVPEQVYLLDHYLGKEAVSNLLSLRYANSIITDLMHHKYVSNIQISALEERDIEGRANYFDNVGILRDMVQSHLLQILAYLTMYAPEEKTSSSIHDEKAKVLKSIKMKNLEQTVVRGQYQGYNKEEGVPKDTRTETYAALKLTMKHPLWDGVPIYIRSGKALKQKWTGVVIEFKPRWAQRQHNQAPNRLVIQLQPTEKIEFHLLTKLGGKTFKFHEMVTGRPIYCSGDCLTEHGRLFLDVISGKQDLFLNFEEIFAAWKVIDPIQKVCDSQKTKACAPEIYKRSTLGPKGADELLERDGFEWFNPFLK